MTPLGYVADLCPFCRALEAFKLMRTGAFGHVILCQTCKLSLAVDPTSYAAIEKELPSDLGELMRTTFPNFHEFYKERLALEDQLRSGGVMSPNTRKNMLSETLQLLAPELDAHLARTRMDQPTRLGCLGTLVIPLLLAALHLSSSLVVGSLILGIVLTLGLAWTSKSRYVKSEVVPKLARALAPLRPTETELATLLENFKSAGLKIGSWVKAPDIIKAMGS